MNERERYPFQMQYAGQTLQGHFWHPSHLGAEERAGLWRRMMESPYDLAVMIFVASSVADWNLKRAGAPVPITEEALMQVPCILLRGVMEAVLERAQAEGLLVSLN